LLVVAIGAPAEAQDNVDQTRVLGAVAPENGVPDPEVQELFSQFLTIELTRAGLTAIEARTTETGRLLAQARREQATYAIAGMYARSGADVTVRFSWYDVATETLSAEATRTGQFDLDFDRLIGEAVDEILTTTGARRERPEPVLPVDPSPAVIAAEMGRGLVSDASFTGFLVNGQASDYFKVGIMPSVFAGYGFPLGGARLVAGLSVGYAQFFTQAELEDTRVRVIPLGAELRYELRGLLPVGVYGRAGGGPALLSFDDGAGSWRTKMIPYASAGFGVLIPLGGMVDVRLEAGYAVFFEEIYPILGFVPTIGTILRLP
jgi:hypothetical protein